MQIYTNRSDSVHVSQMLIDLGNQQHILHNLRCVLIDYRTLFNDLPENGIEVIKQVTEFFDTAC